MSTGDPSITTFLVEISTRLTDVAARCGSGYLSRYTHRVAISNQRLISLD